MKRSYMSLASLTVLCTLAPTIKSSRTRFSSHRGASAFKGELDELMDNVKKVREENQELSRVAKAAQAECESIQKAWKGEVDKLNTELSEKGVSQSRSKELAI